MKTWSKLGVVVGAILAVGAGACGSGDKGDTGPQGAQGEPGAAAAGGAGAAAFSLIEPRFAVLSREIDVAISMQNATLDASSTIDLGDPKITVSNIQVVSPTTLYAHLTIAKDAALGKKDVKVTSGGAALTGTGAFEVKPGMDVTVTPTASAKQGTIVTVDLTNNDPDNPFDTNTFTVAMPDGVEAVLAAPAASSAKNASFTAIVDPTAAPGALTLTGTNGDANDFISAPGAFTIAANAPTPLVSGTAANDTFATAGESHLYDFMSNEDAILALNVTTTVQSAAVPQAVVLATSGTFADALTLLQAPQVPDPNNPFGSLPAPPPYNVTVSYPLAKNGSTADHAYVIINDLAATSSASNTMAITLTKITAAAFAEAATAHADIASAQTATACVAAAALTPCVIKGTTASDSEIDVYKITGITAADLEVSASVGTAGIDVYAIPGADDTTDNNDLSLGQSIELAGDVSSFHTFNDVTNTTNTSWTLVVAAMSGEPTGAYTIGIRKKP